MKPETYHEKLKKKNGFTFIELIITVFVFITGVLGTFLLSQNFIFNTQISVSRLTASYLAQEGIETIRNIRDTNYLTKGRAWDKDIAAGSDFRLDYRSSVFPDATCGAYLQHNGNFYICSADSSGKFQRQITIEKPAPDKMVVSVEVSWSQQGSRHQVVVQTELRKWR